MARAGSAMAGEMLVLLGLLALGRLALSGAESVNDWGRAVLALPVGAALQVVFMFVLDLTGLFVEPRLLLMCLLLVATASGSWQFLRRSSRPGGWAAPLVRAGVAVAGVLGSVAVVRLTSVISVTPDSFRYLTSAALMREPEAEASAQLLEARAFAYPALQALGSEADVGYLPALGVVMALAGLATLAWAGGALARSSGRSMTRVIGLATVVAIVAANNRYWFFAVYVNGHLLMGVWLLALVTVALLSLRVQGRAGPAEIIAMSATAGGVVLLRPEGLLLCLLVVAPVALVAPRSLGGGPVLVSIGAVSLGWFWKAYVDAGGGLDEVATHGWALAAMSSATLVAGVTIAFSPVALSRRWLAVLPGLLLVSMGVAGWLDAEKMASSLVATAANVIDAGEWGVTLLAVATLCIAVLTLLSFPHRAELGVMLASFPPLMLTLAVVREAPAFRIGPGDSLNRAWMHMLLVAALLLALALDSEPRRLPRRLTGPVTALRARLRKNDASTVDPTS